jgi:uncharacterized membrane protein
MSAQFHFWPGFLSCLENYTNDVKIRTPTWEKSYHHAGGQHVVFEWLLYVTGFLRQTSCVICTVGARVIFALKYVDIIFFQLSLSLTSSHKSNKNINLMFNVFVY